MDRDYKSGGSVITEKLYIDRKKTASHNQIKEHCHKRPAPAAPAPGLLVSIFHMSRGKIKKALPSDFEESLSKYCTNCFAQNSGQSNCRST